jgi:hypothetical protein
MRNNVHHSMMNTDSYNPLLLIMLYIKFRADHFVNFHMMYLNAVFFLYIYFYWFVYLVLCEQSDCNVSYWKLWRYTIFSWWWLHIGMVPFNWQMCKFNKGLYESVFIIEWWTLFLIIVSIKFWDIRYRTASGSFLAQT